MRITYLKPVSVEDVSYFGSDAGANRCSEKASLNRDLARARDKRDALASDVATLSTQIADLEARLSAETERRKREHAANGIEAVKKQVRDRYLQFASATAGLREATEMAVAIVPETREFNELLEVIGAEVAKAIDGLSGDLGPANGGVTHGARNVAVSQWVS